MSDRYEDALDIIQQDGVEIATLKSRLALAEKVAEVAEDYISTCSPWEKGEGADKLIQALGAYHDAKDADK